MSTLKRLFFVVALLIGSKTLAENPHAITSAKIANGKLVLEIESYGCQLDADLVQDELSAPYPIYNLKLEEVSCGNRGEKQTIVRALPFSNKWPTNLVVINNRASKQLIGFDRKDIQPNQKLDIIEDKATPAQLEGATGAAQ